MSFAVQIKDATGQTCIQTVNMTVTAPGLDWTQLAWGVPSITGNSFGASVFNPSGTQSDSFNMNAICTNCNLVAAQAHVLGIGTLSYNGPAKNCNLHANISSLGSRMAGFFIIRQTINFVNNQLLLVNFGWLSIPFVGAGILDLPFTVLDTGGFVSTIQVQVGAGFDGNNGVGAPAIQNAQVTGQYSNI